MQILELLGTYLVQLNWDSQQGRDRMQYFFLIGPILFLYHEESLYNQIWIQNNLGFIV